MVVKGDIVDIQHGKGNVIAGNNQFALNFYSELVKSGEEKNIFYSPWSISTALALVYEGARRKTAEEMESVFGFPADNGERRSSFAGIQEDLNNNQGNYTLAKLVALLASTFHARAIALPTAIKFARIGSKANALKRFNVHSPPRISHS